ncbi:hypothetical protein [Actinacidiphila oryziradicis]|uniref:Uncharacterized protein n=1 Tax=Actinacidiphila oryziradicis TaxID=2571141 RepID=A0A4U0RG50_9ACTN|nr:hypothetical protein [Actinacidiphila oryziradicis]TJZ94493.1 hypothetical protein FCI23_53565 [Actinacidiphila oryziradicis]
MADLVSQPEVSKLLREAQTHADIGDYMQAMAARSLAFTTLLDQYSGGLGAYDWEQTPFSFGPRFEGRDRALVFPWPRKDPGDRMRRVTIDYFPPPVGHRYRGIQEIVEGLTASRRRASPMVPADGVGRP